MTPEMLERVLKDLPGHGRLIKDYPYRKVWRLEAEGEAFYLKFYPRQANRWRSLFRGNPAMREFLRLQWLQKANVPAARALSVLYGLTVNGLKGDAVLIEAIEPAESIAALALRMHLAGQPIPDHLSLARQVVEIVQATGRGGMGDHDLHLGNFLVRDGEVFLIDAYPVHRKGMLLRDVLFLANSAAGIATRTDLLRGWNILGAGGRVPKRNRPLQKVYRKLMSRIYGDNRYFTRLEIDGWVGAAIKRHAAPRRWSPVSQMQFDGADWASAWRRLKRSIDTGELRVLKTSRSGDVLEGTLHLGEREIEVIVKRPRRRFWYRYLNEIGRGSRARRAWWKSWRLLYRGIPCAWPIMLMEQRCLGYTVDGIIVFEKVKGSGLPTIDLNALQASDRQNLFHRVGALLRNLEAARLYHWDAKSSNFMVIADDVIGPTPLLVDVDGIRNNWGLGEGMRRLLISMREHRQYTPLDSLHLCRGYAPFAPIALPDTPE